MKRWLLISWFATGFLALQAQQVLFSEETQRLPLAYAGDRSMDVVAADLDNDGDQDVVIAREVTQNWIFWNDGSGHFSIDTTKAFPQAKTYPQGFTGEDSEDIAVFDAEGDGDLDLLFVTEDTDLHEFLLNDGTGTFSLAPYQFPHLRKSNAVLAFHANQDPFPDVLIGYNGQNVLYLNQQDGSFRPDTSGIWPSNTDWTQDLKLADLNGDGNPEIIEGCDQGISNLYLYQNGRYALDNSRLPDAINNTETRKILTGDVDADGDIDLFLCNVGWNPIRNPQDLLFLNDGAANFTNATPTQFPHVHSQTLDGVFMHLNADSLVDLVVTHGDGGQNHATYLNDPAQPGTFQFSDSTFPFFVMNTGIALDTADFDGNGATDVFFGVFQGTDRLLLQERVAAYLEADSHLQLRIFPNPVQDRLRFEVVQLGTIEAAIYDLQGRMIQDNLRLSQQGELDLSDLVPGQYWLRAANGDSLRFEKQ